MDLQLTRSLDGGVHIDCGDEHRALAIWLEQEWESPGFIIELQNAIELAYQGQEWQLIGREYHCQHSHGVIEVMKNSDAVSGEETVIGEPDLYLTDESASCGLEDFELIINSLIEF